MGLPTSLRFVQIAFGGFGNPGTVRRKFMLYQYKREPLNNDEVDKLTNACNTFREKFVI